MEEKKEREKILGPRSRNLIKSIDQTYGKSMFKTTLNDVLPHQRFTLEKVDEQRVDEYGEEANSSPKVNL